MAGTNASGPFLVRGGSRGTISEMGRDGNRLEKEDVAHEEDANRFAGETLIPEAAYAKLVNQNPGTEKIRTFAKSIKVHPGIVVGRLQRDKVLAYGHPAGNLKLKFEWAKSAEQ